MIYDGSLVMLHLKMHGKWQALGGMRTTKLEINNQLIDASNYSNGPWREVLSEAGGRYVSISGSGAFTDAEMNLEFLAMGNKIAEYKLSFANGSDLIGKFQISHYEHIGKIGMEENYILSLESSGRILFEK